MKNSDFDGNSTVHFLFASKEFLCHINSIDKKFGGTIGIIETKSEVRSSSMSDDKF